MFERFTKDSRGIVVRAQEHARQLGHRYVGTEHLLLAAAGTPAPAGDILRQQGLTVERVEGEIEQLIGRGPAAGLFGDLDRYALASIGIDLDAVRARIEASFGADALVSASLKVQDLVRPRPRFGWLRRRFRRPGHRPGQRGLLNVDTAGRYRPGGAIGRGRLPFTLPAKKALAGAGRIAAGRHDQHIGAEHIVLSLLEMNNGPVRAILSELGAPVSAVRAAIVDRYRQAG
jgi:ATP-dependent Clp protease ATP-binding subunit ClpA